MRIKLSMTFK